MTRPGRLDEPLTLPSGLTLPNRLAKAAMTENLADADNQPTERHERLYRRWAEGGSGLLVTGNLMVDRRYLERSRNIVADRHLDVRRLARVREAAAGTPMVAQLNHPGRQTNRFVASTPDFTGQPQVANGVSELLGTVFGDAGVHARSAVGVPVLPLDAPVEVEIIVEV